ncbi:MAG: sugar MFS transporter [Bacteroidales bacterium]|jgi:MFS transporter, FHS family, L-fucose permease|nr:sugar MFS transporter [Bacteroidales bacterium]MDD2205654.1 sugar MFS transporter [Bacteroidales bacterium]MDD3153037.1 sugar MFS transporter [Bacteroidales bacterium]MDD3915166.1 sugar MFS transporter [Bacteroidales bacterium]MDD4634922.1 sugar MFS transporter [Bacteroidales bacterium]
MEKKNKNAYYMFMIGMLFFIFGFVTWLNNVLLPFLRQACELNDSQAWFVTFAFYIAYFVMAIPSSYVLKKTGYAKGISLGLFIMMIGSLLFVPAAINRNYILFLVGLFTQGIGLSLLQTASNPYVTILGPIESAARRMSIMGICNKVAGMIGIFLLSNVLFSGTEELVAKINSISAIANPTQADIMMRTSMLDELARNVIVPYIIMAAVLLVLAILIIFSKLPDINIGNDDEDSGKAHKPLYKYTYMILGIIALFFYVGVEVIAIDSLNLYGAELGYEMSTSKYFGICSLIALTIGYLLAIVLVPKYISQRKALVFQTCLAIVLVVLALILKGIPSVICIILLSFAHAIMWPAIWPLSIEGLGKHTKLASAFLIMAISGGAIIPLIYGYLADATSRHQAYWIMIPCYIIILLFAVFGWKIGRKHID